ncbi:MAG: hypothetical protein A2268_12290 [Candidatus Raymondbacteria bacterium RifOxyA12_full_50_37]|uniref:HTH araC/xylS-type domain-containing protein n=1 Tax=Candidatus Raymondbacteria bacterium RIFOXYD12_FULL_49_13 TaxID=1817890 RepID=A0A1F7F8C8_UNCRA|nr:MAG: hypothetical protein A2350_20440 [Candidatus Raymondbacteria bacterium RifOxyB12_full_50_8]OGJ90254.1 MAG: hypothetical protein A2268_12290 [Candidatus Raymondbacteria bacterium RifOxyA12_full_50_37]OGJ91322.1 MAG: hypothetical protein A2248_03785 [Candidatus Raymondbacteria bacterium RIFOXYA2_FULL_49_16]OGJ97773.1 MAG: hypothetical protein A2453_13935 [Candidatus Raymondbacteria bacterium RIFOXYC2_FULL_50_21]OGK02915.1 MAG: hypothetical protein A2519_06185 [Candidatus Raymondbacteria b
MFLLLLCIPFYCSSLFVFGETILQENFESDSVFYFWITSEPKCAVIQTKNVFAGEKALELQLHLSKKQCVLSKELLFHRSFEMVKNGFYTRFYFKVIPNETFSDGDASNKTITLLSFNLLNLDEFHFPNPRVFLRSAGKGKYEIKTEVRDNSREGGPFVYAGNLPVPVIDSSAWHCLECYLSVKNDTLYDSLFLDNAIVAIQKIKLIPQAQTYQLCTLGEWTVFNESFIKAIYIDNFKIATKRIGPEPIPPTIHSPATKECFIETSPVFELVGDQYSDSFRISVTMENGDLVQDSIFCLTSLCRFSKPFRPDEIYAVRGMTKNVFGSWSGWGRKDYFIASKYPFPHTKSQDILLSIGRPPHNSSLKDFEENDTVPVWIKTTSDTVSIAYIQLNISSEGVSEDWDKRWHLNDPSKNWTFNISILNTPKLFITLNGKSEPLNSFGKVQMDGLPLPIPLPWKHLLQQKNAILFPFVLKKSLSHGLWYVSAKVVLKGGQVFYAHPTFFRFKSSTVRSFSKVLCIVLLSSIIIAFIIFKKGKKEGITPSMVKISATVTSFLQENHTRKLSNEDIAHEIGLTTHRVTEIYKMVTGITPVQKLNFIRIDISKELLRQGEKTISEIAYNLGFTDPRIFQRNFTKIIGMTPSDYRAKYSK